MNHAGSNMPLLRSLVVGLTCVTTNMPLLAELSALPRCLGCTGRNACKVQASRRFGLPKPPGCRALCRNKSHCQRAKLLWCNCLQRKWPSHSTAYMPISCPQPRRSLSVAPLINYERCYGETTERSRRCPRAEAWGLRSRLGASMPVSSVDEPGSPRIPHTHMKRMFLFRLISSQGFGCSKRGPAIPSQAASNFGYCSARNTEQAESRSCSLVAHFCFLLSQFLLFHFLRPSGIP